MKNIMEILIDRQSIEMETAGINNLEEVLVKIMDEHVKRGSAITTVKLNGAVYSEESPHDAVGVLISDIRTLEINTMGQEEIALHFLENGVGQLDLLIQGAEKVSELFRIADEAEANEHYARLLESLRLFLQVVVQVKETLHLNLSAIAFQNDTVEQRFEKLSEIMDEMIEVQEKEDWIMLADLLEYELAPLLEEWKSIVPVLKQ